MAKSKAPVGYRSVMYAPFTIAGDVVTYETPKPIIAAKSMTATDNFASGDDFGDDILQESIEELQSTTLSIVFRSISREIEAALQRGCKGKLCNSIGLPCLYGVDKRIDISFIKRGKRCMWRAPLYIWKRLVWENLLLLGGPRSM